MKNLLTKHSDKNWFPEHNYFKDYFDFKHSIGEQFIAIEQKATELDEKDTFIIALHKHIIAVTAMLEAESMISNDDMRKYLDEPAKVLNQSIKDLYELAQQKL